MYELFKNPRINLVGKKFVLAIAVFFLSFSAFDVFLLKISFQACQLTEPDKVVKFRLVPNKSCQVTTDEFSVHYRINEYGLRDYSFIREKPEDEYRILFLGDSFTEGHGVEIEDTLVKKSENLLNQKFKGHNFRTINAGVAGYSTLLEYLYLTQRGIELNPDFVILNINATDFTEEQANIKHAIKDNDGEIVGVFIERKRHLPNGLENFLKNNSFTYNIFLKQEENIIKQKDKIIAAVKGEQIPEYAKSTTDFKPGDLERDLFAITRDIPTDEFETLFKLVEERILKMRDFLEAKNIRMFLVLIPSGHQVDKNEWQAGRITMKLTDDAYPTRLNETLKEFASKNEIPFFDPTDGLKSYLNDHQPGLYYKFDGHLTPLGHQITAELLFEYLTENELIK